MPGLPKGPERVVRGDPAAPIFPRPAVLDDVLYDYLHRADRMGWSPYDLVDQEQMSLLARPERITEVQLSAIKTVLYVEDHLPGYLSEHLRILTDPTVPDAQQIVNHKVLHFSFRWVSEEDRHAHVLTMYLNKTGLVSEAALGAEMLLERQSTYAFPYENVVETFIYLALQEKATNLYYRALARDLDEPLLKTILSRMSADEASHGTFFYDLLIQCHKGDLDALSRRISAVANDFKMPVQSSLRNYRRQLLNMMKAAPSYRHVDVFKHMMQTVERAAKTYGREALTLVSPDIEPFAHW
jgi:acyl-[acyl-carrier-protein] desaturase